MNKMKINKNIKSTKKVSIISKNKKKRKLMKDRTLEDFLANQKEEYITPKEAANSLNITLSTVLNYYHTGIIKGYQRKRGCSVIILKSSVSKDLVEERIAKKDKLQEEYIRPKEAAALLKVTVTGIAHYYHKGVLEGYRRKIKSNIMISKASVEKFLHNKTIYISVKEAASMLKTAITTILNYYHEGVLEGFQQQKEKHIMILKTSVIKLLEKEKEKKYFTIKRAASILKLAHNTISKYYQQGIFKGYQRKDKGNIMIAKSSVDGVLKHRKEYVTVKKAVFILNIASSTIIKYYHKGIFKGYQRSDKSPLMLSRESVDMYLAKEAKKQAKYLTIQETASMLNVFHNTVRKYYHRGILKGSQRKKKNPILISKISIQKFLKSKKENKIMTNK